MLVICENGGFCVYVSGCVFLIMENMQGILNFNVPCPVSELI